MIEDYAIGGAVAAIYCLEPFDTADLAVFVRERRAGLMILAPVYYYPTGRGYEAKSKSIHIEGLSVEFLHIFNPPCRRTSVGRCRSRSRRS